MLSLVTYWSDNLLNSFIVLGECLMLTNFWRRHQRPTWTKITIISISCGLTILFVFPEEYKLIRFTFFIILVSLMTFTRWIKKQNPGKFLIRVWMMSVILILEIIFKWGKSLLFDYPKISFSLQIIGFLTFGFGICLALLARREMGEQLAIAGNKSKTEIIINQGPYAYVRHPLYTGAFFVTLGLGTMMRSIFVLLGGILLIAYPLHQIAIREEKDLISLNIGYREYYSTVKDLYIPWNWIKKKILKIGS